MIDSNVITVKKTKQGQKSLFLTKDGTAILTEDNTVSISSNDGSKDATPVDANDIDLNVTNTKPNDSGNTKLNPTSNHNFVSLELFNTFYDDYIEYKYYVNDIIQNISFNKELGKSFENETKSQQNKIKLLQKEIQTLKIENKDLKEENKSHLKIIELLSADHDSDISLRNYGNYNPAQTCITNQHHSISSDSSTWNFPRTVSRPRPIDPKPNILTSAISQNRFAPLSIKLENTWKNNNSDNQSNYDYIKKQSNHILQCQNANAIKANKRPDTCITEKYVKNFTPTIVPGNSTYSGITKHGRKICLVDDSHIKRIKRNDFNKDL